MARILVVEDDKDISSLIALALKNAGYEVNAAYDGEMGADFLEKDSYDVVLLDIMLPNIDGYELFSYIKEYSVPVIFITAKGEISDKAKAFHMGADDYLVKPFEIEELILRTENVLRLHGIKNSVLKVKDVTLDADSHIVKKAGREIMLTPKEYELFSMLIRNKGIALSRFAIYDRIWGDEALNETRTLDIHIARLRKKLGLEDEISSVHKVGYILKENT